MKRSLTAVLALFVIVVAYYLLSPLFITKVANDVSPLRAARTAEDMDPAERADYDSQMSAVSDDRKQKLAPMPEDPELVKTAPFLAHAHKVAGKALLIKSHGEYTVRFEDFATVNGPDLHIYLATNIDGTDVVDLGPIQATHGNVNYRIPRGTDLEKYHYVLVWCQPFSVLFSAAMF